MTIETTRAPEGAKTATTEAGRSKASTDRAAGKKEGASGGFAGLMSSLSAPDAQSLPADGSLPTADDALPISKDNDDDAKNVPLALDDKGLLAINLVPIAVPAVTPALVPTAASVLAEGKGVGDKRQLADRTEATLATSGVASDVTTLLNSRRAAQSHAAIQGQGQLQLQSSEARLQPGNHSPQIMPEANNKAPIILNADVLAAPVERRDGKSANGQVRTGLEGFMGGAVADRLGINPTYEIAATSAVVPDTQVAETVSYWATNGVQSAELTLDGLGNEPVKVHISVEGDQAQVDFRSNQPDVRQALESASAQLKTMLSGEGLQLTGMSVGTSNQGHTQSESRQPKPAPRQSAVVSMAPVQTTAARTGNPSVGRALDLYV